MAKSQEILDAISKLNESFGRMDEKTNNIWRLTEAQEKHLVKLNGHLDNHSGRIITLETQVAERTVPKHKRSKKIITGYSGVVLVVMTLLFYLGQAKGWW